MSLPPLATDSDVVARLGRELNPVEAARIDALLMDGSAHIRRFTRKDFVFVADDVKTIRALRGVIKLPGRPVTDVSEVLAISGLPGVPNIQVTWYQFDQIDQITVPDPALSGIINLPEAWYELGWFTDTYQVTYSHGYAEVPDDVLSVLCTAVISVLTAPTMAAGVIGESVGGYSYRMERTGGGIGVALKEADIDSLADYRDKVGTIQMGYG
jgi:hypothetical protein